MRQGNAADFGVFAFLLSIFYVINAVNSSFSISYINNVCVDRDERKFFINLKHLVSMMRPLLLLQITISFGLLFYEFEAYGITSKHLSITMFASVFWIVYESFRRIYIILNRAQFFVVTDFIWASIVIVFALSFPLSAIEYFMIYIVLVALYIILFYLRMSDYLIGDNVVKNQNKLFWEFGLTGGFLQVIGVLYVQSVQVVALSKGGVALLASYEGPRILIMPIMTLTMGLLNFYNSKFRIAYTEGGLSGFQPMLNRAVLNCVSLSIIYFVAVLVAYELGWMELLLNGFILEREVLYAWIIIIMLMVLSTFVSVVFSVIHKPKLSIVGRLFNAGSVLLLLFFYYESLNATNIAYVRVIGESVLLLTVVGLYMKIKKREHELCD